MEMGVFVFRCCAPHLQGCEKVQPRAEAKFADGEMRFLFKARLHIIAVKKDMGRFRNAVAGEIDIIKKNGPGRKRRVARFVPVQSRILHGGVLTLGLISHERGFTRKLLRCECLCEWEEFFKIIRLERISKCVVHWFEHFLRRLHGCFW